MSRKLADQSKRRAKFVTCVTRRVEACETCAAPLGCRLEARRVSQVQVQAQMQIQQPAHSATQRNEANCAESSSCVTHTHTLSLANLELASNAQRKHINICARCRFIELNCNCGLAFACLSFLGLRLREALRAGHELATGKPQTNKQTVRQIDRQTGGRSVGRSERRTRETQVAIDIVAGSDKRRCHVVCASS